MNAYGLWIQRVQALALGLAFAGAALANADGGTEAEPDGDAAATACVSPAFGGWEGRLTTNHSAAPMNKRTRPTNHCLDLTVV